jgi:hypothetical protein
MAIVSGSSSSSSGGTVAKVYRNKPAAAITRAATTVGAFSTAWQITSVVVASGQNVLLTVSAQTQRTTGTNDFILCLFRGVTQLAVAFNNGVAAAGAGSHVAFAWVDENPGAGTYTYEVQGAMFTSGTLTIHQTNITTDTQGGTSVFTAQVYNP